MYAPLSVEYEPYLATSQLQNNIISSSIIYTHKNKNMQDTEVAF